MRIGHDWFAQLIVIPTTVLLVLYVASAIVGAVAGAEGYFFANVTTLLVGFCGLTFYFHWQLSGRRDLAKQLGRRVPGTTPLGRAFAWARRYGRRTSEGGHAPVRDDRAPFGAPESGRLF